MIAREHPAPWPAEGQSRTTMPRGRCAYPYPHAEHVHTDRGDVLCCPGQPTDEEWDALRADAHALDLLTVLFSTSEWNADLMDPTFRILASTGRTVTDPT